MNEKKPYIAAIIPARYASTRFPGKPLFKINDKTLIQHTYENAKHCTLIDDITIATDDQRIFAHARGFGAHAVMTPENCATGSDRLAYVVENNPELQKADIIINIQGDEPCLDPEVTRKVIEALLHDKEAVMSTAVVPLTEEDAHNPNCVKCVLDLKGNVLYFSRAMIPGGKTLLMQKSVPYYKHVGIYAYRPWFLLNYAKLPMTPLQVAEDLEQLKVLEHGYKIKSAVVPSVSADVNTPEDIKKIEIELCRRNTSL